MFGNTMNQTPSWRNYVCGLYYTVPSFHGQPEKLYLPQVELEAHATILATTSRTTLTQTFVNPSTNKGIREVKYTFPLYDGVSVVGFTCFVDDRTIVGEVKEKEKARTDFKEAVARGETAGLFEQLDTADVFSTTVGNVPPGAKVIIKITYLGELKHDMEVDGIRFTIPNIIAPRYGRYPSAYYNNSAQPAVGRGIAITVDAEMVQGSFIQKILSPSHPISVSMGTTSIAPHAEPTMAKASATLSLGSAQLDNDFVLQVVAKDTGVPKAVLETHPTIPNQRALMATLVPKFALPPERPEIVFVCDRSGSMGGNNITLVKQALKVFLKSLPVGVMFNICSFGSSYSFLWPRSVSYSQETLEEATRHVDTFSANFGGTEMLAPIQATIENRYKDIPLEVMMLTDGAIWNQVTLFTYLNKEVAETKAPIRVYSLGVGAGVSHSLIEGLARAGNGFSQTVADGEKMDSKVVRMLKGALSPHVNDYTLEVKYSGSVADSEDDDFEIVEKVADSLTVKLNLNEKEEKPNPKKPISLFDTSVDLDKEEPPAHDETGEARYSHLPKVSVPNIIQAPQTIPPLFAFNRTTMYLLLGPDAPKQTPKSVILRGTSAHGPLELEFPIQILDTPGETIHQLAVKKAMSELEEGRGWLPEAKDATGKLLKAQYESRFSGMVEREAVRLGVQFQVGGKWCSFVAVEKKRKTPDDQKNEDWEWLENEEQGANNAQLATSQRESNHSSSDDVTVAVSRLKLLGQRMNSEVEAQNRNTHAIRSSNTNLSGVPLNEQRLRRIDGGPHAGLINLVSTKKDLKKTANIVKSQSPGATKGGGLFGGFSGGGGLFGQAASQGQPTGASLFGQAPQQMAMQQAQQAQQQQQQQQQQQHQAFVGSPPYYHASASMSNHPAQGNHALQDYQMQTMLLEQQNKKRLLMARQEQGSTRPVFRAPAMSLASAPIMPNPPNPFSSTSTASAFGAANQPRPATLFAGPPPPPPPPQSSGPPPPQPSVQQSPGSVPFGAIGDDANFGNLGLGFGNQNAPENFDFDSFLHVGNDQSGFGALGADFGFDKAAPAASKPGAAGGLFGNATAFGSGTTNVSTRLRSAATPPVQAAPQTDDEILAALIRLQNFQGYWDWTPELFATIKTSEGGADYERDSAGYEKVEWVTALVIAFFEERLEKLKGSWELVVEKARGWLQSKVEGGNEKAEEMINKARTLV